MTHGSVYSPAFAGNILQIPSIVKSSCLQAKAYTALPKHYHPSTEVMLLLNGVGYIEIEDKHLYAKKGDLIVYPSYQTHQDKFFGVEDCGASLYLIRLTGIQIRDLPKDHIFPPDSSPVLPTGESVNELELLFNLIHKECTLCRPGCSTIVNRAVLGILLIILRLSETKTDKKDDESRLLCQQALEFIHLHYQNHLKVQDIASALSVSHSHLTHVFSKEMHLSPSQYIDHLRISEARQMLLFTKSDPHAICRAVGYERYSVFLEHFVEQAGLTPEAYRRGHSLASEVDFGDHIEIC